MGPAVTVARTPINDWLLRFWRLGLQHTNDARVTVAKDNIRRPTVSSPHYQEPSLLFPYMADLAAGKTPDGIRGEISLRQAEHVRRGGHVRDFEGPAAPDGLSEMLAGRLTHEGARLFLATGIDPYEEALKATGMQFGWILRDALSRRTGESMPAPPNLNEMVQAARLQLTKSFN